MKTITFDDINSLSDPEFLALNSNVIIEDTSLDELETRVVEVYDFEVEYDVFEFSEEDGRLYLVCVDDPAPAENSGCYWTTTGDNPVLSPLATKNDQRSRLLNEVLPPNKQFYSAAKPNNYDKQTHRNYIKTMMALRKYAGDMAKLQQLWLRFWKKFFHLKEMDEAAQRRNNPICSFRPDPEKEVDKWLKPWHIKRVRMFFNSLGIYAKKRR